MFLAEFLEPTGRVPFLRTTDIGVPLRHINEIGHGKRAVPVDPALRLTRSFATTPRFWLNLQAWEVVDVEADRFGDRLDREVAARAG